MCGVAGFWFADALTEETASDWLTRMTDAIVHRGPDSSGVMFDSATGVGLGHRRLSIIDVSDSGAQPMWSASKRYCITYNGEVYNAPELRAELEEIGGVRHPWRGHSDTEVMLAAIEHWGLDDALSRFAGMFAFAILDRQEMKLYLVRDRVGIKPMFFSQTPAGLAFGSELPALFRLPWMHRSLDRQALIGYFRFLAVDGNECIFEGVQKVAPGSMAVFSAPRVGPIMTSYWSANEVHSRCKERGFEGDDEDAVDAIQSALAQSVKERMRSDVAFGAFLSGGIDSSLVVSLMQQQSGAPIKTFSIGNTSAGYDESRAAEGIANHLGCEHHMQTVDDATMLDLVPSIAQRWDEPFADSSQLPTYLVSKMARALVTVSLSGDGGDEVFGGYNRYVWAPRFWRLISKMPRMLRRSMSLATNVRVETWNALFDHTGLSRFVRLAGDKIYKLVAASQASSQAAYYESLRTQWADADALVLNSQPQIDRFSEFGALKGSYAERMMMADFGSYLPDDILTKVDRASMAASLETRVPLLDHRVIELAWSMPLDVKIKNNQGKWILREILARHVPTEMFERPKMGFGVPIGTWLRGPLRAWADDMLSESRIDRRGVLDSKAVGEVWRAHLAREGNHEHRLWAVLMFESWADRFL